MATVCLTGSVVLERRQSSCVGRSCAARLIEPVLDLLRQGVTPEKIALSLAFGLGIGIFPVLGVSTVLCTVVAIVFRLNLPAIQLVNYLASPLQLALIIPFVRVGEHLLGLNAQPLSIAEGFRIMAEGVLHAIVVLWDAIVHAALGVDRHRAGADLRALLRIQCRSWLMRRSCAGPSHGGAAAMIGNLWLLLLIGTLVVVAIMFGLWWLGIRNHNFSYVDIGWSVNFAVLAVLYAWLAPGDLPRRVIIAAMFTAHGLRLGWHLSKRIIGEPEEGRYQQLRKDWGGSGSLNLKFLGFFEFQARAQRIPHACRCSSRASTTRHAFTRSRSRASRSSSSALIGESTADAQLAAFKRKPANQGGVCDVGPVALLAPPELLLRMAHLDCLRGVRAGLAPRLDRARDARADAALPDQRDGPQGHRGAGASLERRALPALSGPHERFRTLVSKEDRAMNCDYRRRGPPELLHASAGTESGAGLAHPARHPQAARAAPARRRTWATPKPSRSG